MKPYYMCNYCEKKLYDGDVAYKNEYSELYCSMECLNHCEKITVNYTPPKGGGLLASSN